MDAEPNRCRSEESPHEPGRSETLDARFLAKAIEAAGLGVLALDSETGALRHASAAADEILRTLAEASGRDALQALAEAAFEDSRSPGSTEGSPSRSLELGSRVVGFSSYPTAGTLWVLFRDVTEKVRLTSLAESLQLSDALLGVFTALRHDIGNSVNAAKTSLHVLRQGLGRHDADAIRRYVDRALESLAGAEVVLATLRDYGFASRPRLGSVRLGAVVDAAALACDAALAAHGTTLDVVVPERNACVLADPGFLEEVLCDLVRRAELRVRGGSDPQVRVRIDIGPETAVVRIAPVASRGPAPARPPEEVDLRMLVVRRLVTQMAGSVHVGDGDAVVTLRRIREGE